MVFLLKKEIKEEDKVLSLFCFSALEVILVGGCLGLVRVTFGKQEFSPCKPSDLPKNSQTNVFLGFVGADYQGVVFLF